MARDVNPADSPTAKAMDRAIDQAIEGGSRYPEHAAFVNAASPNADMDLSIAVPAPSVRSRACVPRSFETSSQPVFVGRPPLQERALDSIDLRRSVTRNAVQGPIGP